MSIHNVTEATLDHHCSYPGCEYMRVSLAHSEAKIVDTPSGKQIQITCPDGHIECFTPDLPAWEETSPTRDEASREQIRNNRLLHKHLGLSLVEERSGPLSLPVQ